MVIASAAVTNACLSLIMPLWLAWRLREFMTAGDIAELVGKSLGVLIVPFAALAAANNVARRLVLGGSGKDLAYDTVVAMTAMLPMQLAVLVYMGVGPVEISITAGAFSIVYAILIVYAANAVLAPERANRLLFSTPVAIALAMYITFHVYRQMPDIGSMFFGGIPSGIPGRP